jgi:hypothetical protein
MTKSAKTERDDIKTSIKAAALLGAIFTLVAVVTHDGRTAMSVGLGAAIAVANLVTMRAIVRALIRGPEEGEEEEERADEEGEAAAAEKKDHRAAGKRGGWAWGLFATFKILILFGGIWLLLSKGLVAPIPLVVGYGVLPLGIAGAGVWNSLRPRP